MRILLAFLALVLGAGMLAAKPKPDFTITETRDVIYEYARCVVRRDHDKAAEVVLANLDNNLIVRKYDDLLSGDCLMKAAPRSLLGVKMKLPGDMLHYALADALVNAELANTIPGDLAAVPFLEHRELDLSQIMQPAKQRGRKLTAEQLQERRDRAIAASYLSRFGECVVRADVRAAHALLMTRPSTPGEVAAFNALRPVFNNCVRQGQEFSLNRIMLRGTVALNYYRLAHAAREVGKVSGAMPRREVSA
jgi:hypothetical protein